MTTQASRAPELSNISVMSQEECLALLGAASVGRVAFVGPSGPVIHPVNYLMDHDTIVVRTSPYTLFGGHASGQVAFEVDEIDAWLTRGWSVLVTGRCEPVDDPEEAIELRRQGRLEPWADGHRNMFVRITPREITGRRISS
jgi:nitroimidazol reductase NimA-like FMN-containing flavoprotein (pyridoxamine 5'-phosphate oxidase superfamily)